jgi:hypothetical protein
VFHGFLGSTYKIWVGIPEIFQTTKYSYRQAKARKRGFTFRFLAFAATACYANAQYDNNFSFLVELSCKNAGREIHA